MRGFWRWLLNFCLEGLYLIKETFFFYLGFVLIVVAFLLAITVDPLFLVLLIPAILSILYEIYLIEEEDERILKDIFEE